MSKTLANAPAKTKQKRPWFEYRRQLGLAECPYLERTMLDLRLFSIRLHHFRTSDDDRALHDHPWWFFTLILKGGYTDVSDTGNTEMKQGRIYFRRAHHKHTVQVHPGGVWTLCLMGPKKQAWGFFVPRKSDGKMKKIKANKYFIEHGHHPCE